MTSPLQLEKAIFKKLDVDLADDDAVWSTAREILVTGGWRAGKSVRAAARAFRQILRPTTDGLIWFLGPDYFQARQEYLYLRQWLEEMNLFVKGTMPTEGQCTLTTKTGWRVETKSAKHAERLGSVAPDGVVMCEPGQMPEEVYIMVLGRVAQKRGWIFLAGTLEDDSTHPRWAWYEEYANAWMNNGEGSQQRAFSLPSWSNRRVFPGGENDPEIQALRERYSEYTFARRIAAMPVGAENPCFPALWEEDANVRFFEDLHYQISNGLHFIDGAIGVDFGTTPDHPSTVVAIHQDGYSRFWIREAWAELGGNPESIVMQVDRMKRTYNIAKCRVDPQQAVLAFKLGANVAYGGSAGGGIPSETRIGIASGLLEDGYVVFDSSAAKFLDPVSRAELSSPYYVFSSMRRMRRKRDARGRLVFARELGDDYAQAALYALEEMRGQDLWMPNLDRLGGIKESWGELPSRASQVGRV